MEYRCLASTARGYDSLPVRRHRLDAFKRTTGQTPHEFLVTCRIRKAMDILAKDPSVRITSLALDLGFSSSQHFAARFRRETGRTPSAWRENSGRS